VAALWFPPWCSRGASWERRGFLKGSTPENLRFLVYEAYFTASVSLNHRRSFRNPAKFLNVTLVLVKFPSISGVPYYIQLIFRKK
jgi:hypothetical protein